MSVAVRLSLAEIALAAGVGVRRQTSAIYHGRMPRYGDAGYTDWQSHVEGALAEFAVAKHLGRFWSGAHDNLRAADVGPYQVRSSTYLQADLPLHPPDADHEVFILVVGRNGAYDLRGWIVARDGKRLEWWGDPAGKNRHAYFVPADALHAMADLPVLSR